MSALLLENGDGLLLEDGFGLLMEDGGVTPVDPITPGSATASNPTQTTIDLDADDATGGEPPYAYQWQVSLTGSGGWSDLAGLDSLAETATGLVDGTTYYFRLMYTDSLLEVAYSDVASETTDPPGEAAEPQASRRRSASVSGFGGGGLF